MGAGRCGRFRTLWPTRGVRTFSEPAVFLKEKELFDDERVGVEEAISRRGKLLLLFKEEKEK